jgi:disulfide bond formation protein DsbB
MGAFQSLIPFVALVAQIVWVVLLAIYLGRKSWGREWAQFVGENSLGFATLVVLVAVFGSLFYSLGVGYEPCELCWWQRIFIFPQLVIFALAWKGRDLKAFTYSLWLSVLSLVAGGYQIYIQYGGHSFLACTSTGGACAKNYVNAFGYVSIPVMSVTIALYLILLALFAKNYENRNA